MEYRNLEHRLLMEFIASLTLADHMGDVSEDVSYVLKLLGMEDLAASDWGDETMQELHKLGVTTLYGTSLEAEPEDKDDDD